jgi:hypothetical protein
LTDANGCATPAITGFQNCNCLTDAGQMLNTLTTFCADASATATWDNNPALDGDDQVEFVLHTQAGSTLGMILATNTTPSFNYTNGLQYNTTYYISAVAGSSANGIIDLTDPCLSVAPGAPIRWKPLPTVSIGGDTTICAGTTVPLKIQGNGTYPLMLNYSLNNGVPTAVNINNQQNFSLALTPDSTFTYQFISVTDGSNPTCTTPLSQKLTVTVNKPVNAGVANDPLSICADLAVPVQLINLITGADFGGSWSDVSTIPVQGGQFAANTGTLTTGTQAPGIYKFKYLLSAKAPCPDQSTTVSVVVQALPIADAGEDQTLNCNQTTATLGGPNTSLGGSYNWLSNNINVGNNANLITSNPGAYTLQVSSTAGCTASDAVVIDLDAELPFAKKITKTDVRCFGDKNGRIIVDSIVSTHLPVLISINNGPFGNKTEFYPLKPGNYVITLQDANGCEWDSDTIKVGQPPLLTADLGLEISIPLGDTAKITANISVPLSAIDTIYWTPLMDSLHVGTPYQEFVPFTSQKITIRVVDTAGCATSDRVQVIFKQMRDVYIPNIIKPDADNNNVLTVFGGKEVDNVESLQVYDRWGEKIYEAFDFPPNSQSVHWDGKYKGSVAAPGVYIYYAVVRFINGEKLLFKGDVTILR